jgi:hypothetical protein
MEGPAQVAMSQVARALSRRVVRVELQATGAWFGPDSTPRPTSSVPSIGSASSCSGRVCGRPRELLKAWSASYRAWLGQHASLGRPAWSTGAAMERVVREASADAGLLHDLSEVRQQTVEER